MASLYSEFHL